MGGGASKPTQLDIIIENELDKTLCYMDLKKKDVVPFWKLYKKIDLDDSGSIDIDEIFLTHNIQITEFAQRCFMSLDADGNHKASFSEFLIGLWNYCSADALFLHKMAFDMADEDGGGKLTTQEVQALLFLIYGKGPSKKSQKEMYKKVRSTMKLLDTNQSGTVTFQEWEENSRHIQSLFRPSLELQKQLQKAYMGTSYWKKASKHRVKTTGNKDLIKLHIATYDIKPHHKGHIAKRASEHQRQKESGEYESNSDDEDEDEEDGDE